MDYTEAFKNLRTNNKYGRRSPHKAVLMLTVIELYEQNVLSDNEIYYDDTLKSMFLKVWNRVLPSEPLFHPEAYLPFWYLQSDSFWHIVPVRGKEDILSLMRDTNCKPSEAKLCDCVKYAELDDDLYFLMTLPSGRSSLKRVLLETYTNLSEGQIDRMSESVDNAIDYSISALSDYEKILSNEKDDVNIATREINSELVSQFHSLNEDIQIVLNLQYYSFLKSHRGEREMFKDICPTVYDLLDKILHPIHQGDITQSFAFTFDNFLSDLKIALMSEDGSMDIIDKIGVAIDLLRGNINNAGDIEPETGTKDIEPTINEIVDDSCVDDENTSSQEYTIENKVNRCYIIDCKGERVFSSEGKILRLNKNYYKINYTGSLVSMFTIQEKSNGLFSLVRRILSAKQNSPLYVILDKRNYLKQFNAVKFDDSCDEYYVQVDDRWYGSSGYYADFNNSDKVELSNIVSSSESQVISSGSKDVSENMEVEHVFLDSSGKIIEKITSSQLDISSENRKGKIWTHEEEELITLYFKQGKSYDEIASTIGRSELAIKLRLAKLGLIEYNYGQEDEAATNISREEFEEKDFKIENGFTSCSIINNFGDSVFSDDGKLKYIGEKLYRLNLKKECFTIKCMRFNGSRWIKGGKKIVAYPQTELYKIMDYAIDYCDEVEDIVDSPVFENCKLKVNGKWYMYNGSLLSTGNEEVSDTAKRNSDSPRVLDSPLYTERKQAILRAMGFFRLPAKIKDIVRTISRTAWGSTIKEQDVEDMIKTMSEVESVEGKYILRKR